MEKIIITPELVEDILFAMEDQADKLALDLETSKLTPDSPDGKLRLPLPKWTKREGFQLMETYGKSLNNPLVKLELQEILSSGQGVFKAFKERLKKEGNLYRSWLHFKRIKMEEVLWEWADIWQDRLEIRRSSETADEGLHDLLLEDFTLRIGKAEDWSALGLLDREIFEENRVSHRDSQDEYSLRRRHINYGEPQQVLLLAEDPSGAWAGLAWGQTWPGDRGKKEVFEVLQWWVSKDYRGLGLGGLVLSTLIERISKNSNCLICFDQPKRSALWKEILQKQGWDSSGEMWIYDPMDR